MVCGMRTSGLLCVPFVSDVSGSVWLSFTYFAGTSFSSRRRVSLRFGVVGRRTERSITGGATGMNRR
jgi:hypothetical protein